MSLLHSTPPGLTIQDHRDFAALGFSCGAWDCVAFLFNCAIPTLAFGALTCTTLLFVGSAFRRVQATSQFGRRSYLVTAASVLFVFSCFYRSIFVADEGAALCRGAPSVFNAPASGRAVATVGEIALVVQISAYINSSARRLELRAPCWARHPLYALGPVLLAETFSWTGVLTGNSKFYCCEYLVWVLIALGWAWDSAELLNKSTVTRDIVAHSCLLVGAMALLLFNLGFEIPHFFLFQRSEFEDSPAHMAGLGIWLCIQDPQSPVWAKRLPFFFCYFALSSWASVAIAHHHLHMRCISSRAWAGRILEAALRRKRKAK